MHSGTHDRPNLRHLFIALTDPFVIGKNPQKYIFLVPIQSITSWPYDKTCLLKVGDHPFIKHTSFINYSETRNFLVDGSNGLIQGIKDKTHTLDKPFTDPIIFEKILKGVMNSNQTRKKITNNFESAISGSVFDLS